MFNRSAVDSLSPAKIVVTYSNGTRAEFWMPHALYAEHAKRKALAGIISGKYPEVRNVVIPPRSITLG